MNTTPVEESRSTGLLDRIAATVTRKVAAITSEKEAADREIHDLIAIQQRYRDLLQSKSNAAERLKHADQVRENIEQEAQRMRTEAWLYYSDSRGGDRFENITGAYMRIHAAELAISDFSRVRAVFEAEVAQIDRQLAEIEKEHSDLLT